jgi:hypothetical protein
MPTPTGTIRASDINTEIGATSNASMSLNSTNVRSLAQKTTLDSLISYNDLRNKSRAMAVTVAGATLDIVRGGYRVIAWEDARSGSLSVTTLGMDSTFNTIEYVLCAGGGGGGGSGGGGNNSGGGGGAGELIHGSSVINSTGWNISVSVGAGGSAGSGANVKGSNGGNTTMSGNLSFTCRGGGGGGAGASSRDGLAGGSGGGSGMYGNTAAVAGAATAVSPGLGNAGGLRGPGSTPCNAATNCGGGGGGAGGAGGIDVGGNGFLSPIYTTVSNYEFSTGGNGSRGGYKADTYGSGGGAEYHIDSTNSTCRRFSGPGRGGAVVIRFKV